MNDRFESSRFGRRASPEGDLARDPRLAALLRAAEPARAEPDWDRLHAAIVARGALPLAGLRQPPVWWELAAGWARAALPIAVAASLALAALLASNAPAGSDELASLGTQTVTVRDALEDAVTTADSESELLPALIGSEGWLMSAAFDRQ